MISGSWEDRENEEEICLNEEEICKEDNWEGYIGGGEDEKEEMG